MENSTLTTPIDEPKSDKTSVSISRKYLDEIDRIAKIELRDRSKQVEYIFRDFIDRYNNNKKDFL